MPELVTLLEWSAFGSSLLCSWVYGNRTIGGPLIGVVTAILFMLFGWFAGVPAAIAANLIFLGVHIRNGYKMIIEDKSRTFAKIAEGVNYLVETIYDDSVKTPDRVKDIINLLVRETHGASVAAGWWTDLETGEPLPANIPLKTVLIHSEISEAMEGHRKDANDDKLPHRKMFEVELADAVIRAGDLLGKIGSDHAEIYLDEFDDLTEYLSDHGPYHYELEWVDPGEPVEVMLCKLHEKATSVFVEAKGNLEALYYVDMALCDFLLACFQVAHCTDIDLGGAIAEKMEFNANRPDHKIENRKKGGGKKY